MFYTGSDQTLLLLGNRVHKQCTNLQQHSTSKRSAPDDAHSEAVLLGGEPCRPEWSGPKGSRWVKSDSNRIQSTPLTLKLLILNYLSY